MKAITLHTAACDNGLTRHEAGETLEVGQKPHQIEVTRAGVLLGEGGAIEAALLRKTKSAIQPDHTSDEAE